MVPESLPSPPSCCGCVAGNVEKFGGALGAADTSFAEMLPEVVQRMGWEVLCNANQRGKMRLGSKAKSAMAQAAGGCQIDDRGKPASHIFRKPLNR